MLAGRQLVSIFYLICLINTLDYGNTVLFGIVTFSSALGRIIYIFFPMLKWICVIVIGFVHI